MDGGAVAKNAFRYQDWCTMYFTLDSFFKDTSLFENVYCEQGKLDFEIWSSAIFAGFQVKTTTRSLSAAEINRIFLKYIDRSKISKKKEGQFYFVFGKHPEKSLNHLFNYILGGSSGVKYDARISKYIGTALKNIPLGSFYINFHHFDEQVVESLVFSLAAKVLRSKSTKKSDIETEVINNFIKSFRDEIDKISCKSNDSERVYSNSQLEAFIINFLSTYTATKLEDEGEKFVDVRIKVPKDLQGRAIEASFIVPSPVPQSKRSPTEGDDSLNVTL